MTTTASKRINLIVDQTRPQFRTVYDMRNLVTDPLSPPAVPGRTYINTAESEKDGYIPHLLYTVGDDGISLTEAVPFPGTTIVTTNPKVARKWSRYDGRVWVPSPANDQLGGLALHGDLQLFDIASPFTRFSTLSQTGSTLSLNADTAGGTFAIGTNYTTVTVGGSPIVSTTAVASTPVTIAFTGPVALSTPVYATVNRSQVTITLKGVFATSTANTFFTSSTALPTGTYRTDFSTVFAIPIIDNSTPSAAGWLAIATDGFIRIYKNAALDGFTAANNAGWNNISVSFSL